MRQKTFWNINIYKNLKMDAYCPLLLLPSTPELIFQSILTLERVFMQPTYLWQHHTIHFKRSTT